MAVAAFDVALWINGFFHRVMYACRVQDRMGAELIELLLKVFIGHSPTMTGKTVFLLVGKIQQARFCTGIVRGVAILATIGRNRGVGSVRPGIIAGTVPPFRRDTVRAILPGIDAVAVEAEGRGLVVLDEKFPKLVIMRIMARDALHLVIVVEPHFVRESGRVPELTIGGNEGAIINE
jgi:hypothetical protein